MDELNAEVLVVGGGTGGAAAAIQAARQGAKTILVSEFPWLGGMLTAAGVPAPDGNELAAFQTGLWGAFVRELHRRQSGGLDNGWVSFFTYNPRTGGEIFVEWVEKLSNLHWISGQVPVEVLRQGNCITGVCFENVVVRAPIVVDATELGDLLALGEVPYRWGWELQSEWDEPSAPIAPTPLTERYPVQAPTWVVIMQDYGVDGIAPEIPAPPIEMSDRFLGAWDAYGTEQFLNYGRLPGNRFMINWPIQGNDYGEGVGRLIESEAAKLEFFQEARWHSQSFARFIQTQLGRRYGLAKDIFPKSETDWEKEIDPISIQLKTQNSKFKSKNWLGGGAYALYPYFRESRRLRGVRTVTESDILPMSEGRVARLSLEASGVCDAIAFGNYPNDHHYPNMEGVTLPLNLQPKSIRWGGRWTGTPFTIPYGALIPVETDGLLVCEKNISVSHIANGATRLQPVVLGIGQAAGMAAALCIERNCQPRDLPVRVLQEALLQDPVAPAAVIPLFNVTPDNPDWLYWQRYYLDNPDAYPATGDRPPTADKSHQKEDRTSPICNLKSPVCKKFSGIFQRHAVQDYKIILTDLSEEAGKTWILVTLQPAVDRKLQTCLDGQILSVWGRLNHAGSWLLAESID